MIITVLILMNAATIGTAEGISEEIPEEIEAVVQTETLEDRINFVNNQGDYEEALPEIDPEVEKLIKQQEQVEQTKSTEIYIFDTSGKYVNLGKSSDVVFQLNKYLKSKGYNVKESNKFDNNTKNAVREYQRVHGLKADGIAGKQTFTFINKDLTKGATVEITTEVQEFDIKGMNLRKGKLSEDVLRLNKYLKIKGYKVTEGYMFDNDTSIAVKEYQRVNGLKVDGDVGKQTFEFINNDMKTQGIIIDRVNIKVTKDITNKDLLILNKNNNTMYHFKNKTLVKKYHIAVGKTYSATPNGKFSIVNKSKNPAWGGAGKFKPIKGGVYNNPLGKRWMGLSVGGGGSYGIHGNYDKNSIGTYASLGCVRMYNEDVEKLFDIIPVGTAVWIGTEKMLKDYGIEF